ncbi:MAG: hypothetical protein M5U12_31660 [Verrucomicrobia bacterium]|nr:hypothetical protein [Verrucomicrobiota bacterium]
MLRVDDLERPGAGGIADVGDEPAATGRGNEIDGFGRGERDGVAFRREVGAVPGVASKTWTARVVASATKSLKATVDWATASNEGEAPAGRATESRGGGEVGGIDDGDLGSGEGHEDPMAVRRDGERRGGFVQGDGVGWVGAQNVIPDEEGGVGAVADKAEEAVAGGGGEEEVAGGLRVGQGVEGGEGGVGGVEDEDLEICRGGGGSEGDADVRAVGKNRKVGGRTWWQSEGGGEGVVVRSVEAVKGGGVVLGEGEPVVVLAIDGDAVGVDDVLGGAPGEGEAAGVGGRAHGFNDEVELVAFEDAVGLARRVVAATGVEKGRDILGGALAVADADLEFARLIVDGCVIAMLLFPPGGEGGAEVEELLAGDTDFAAAAIDGIAGFDDDVLGAAGGVGVLLDAEPADDAPAVELLVVPAVLADEVALLVGEIARNDEFAVEVVVPCHLRDFALGTGVFEMGIRATGHKDSSIQSGDQREGRRAKERAGSIQQQRRAEA